MRAGCGAADFGRVDVGKAVRAELRGYAWAVDVNPE